MGLEILSPKPGSAQPGPFDVDIIAIHGLNGDATNTWKHPKNNHFWLQDSLPLDVKGARIMSYGYNADVAFGNTTANVWDHAKSLLGSLVDERETDDESKRPIIFIAHSLGGIIVKQALVWAHTEPRYQAIEDHTLGIVFFGTPHRGSVKATYGKILANVATGVMHKPKTRLIGALQTHSETLKSLTQDFKHRAPNMEILTFYEMRPMLGFSTLIVEKTSALLELSHEDSQAVDTNHRDMCKFDTRNDETYKKLVKRVNRMLKGKDKSLPASDSSPPKLRNKHFELPFDVSPYFTGGNDVCVELREGCLPSEDPHAQNMQQRFVLYGLGGSGKTQMALKFANDYRERFWGVFFIDTSSVDMARQAFSNMARVCKVGEGMEDFRRCLTNSLEPWLLILDNADDPSLNVSQFFPVGNRGTIIVTSRNPDCRCHATVGSRELREMESDEAITLLLRSGDLLSENEDLRSIALPIVQTLGNLALAVSHAGASIRQRVCSLEDYLDNYARRRKKLLSSRPVQADSNYEYTVYTTWEISVDFIKELSNNATDSTAANALEFLTLFGFCHFDDITEDMFRSAWKAFGRTERYTWWASNLPGMVRDRRLLEWDSIRFNESMRLLSSYSLIYVSGPNNRISLHPLVHSWIRDSLNEEVHLRWWIITVSTLALAAEALLFPGQMQLRVHLRHCIGIGQVDDLFVEDDVILDRVQILSLIISVYDFCPGKDNLTLSERALEYSRKSLGDGCYSTCLLSYQLSRVFSHLYEYQKASDLLQGTVEVSIRVLGPAESLTLDIMTELAWVYRKLGRKQEALKLAKEKLAVCEKSLEERDAHTLSALCDVAAGYSDMGRYNEAINVLENTIAKRDEMSNVDIKTMLRPETLLAVTYDRSGRHEAAFEMFQNTLEKQLTLTLYGEDDPYSLYTMAYIAVEYGKIGRPEEGIPLMIKALEVGQGRMPDKWLGDQKEALKWLQYESAQLYF